MVSFALSRAMPWVAEPNADNPQIVERMDLGRIGYLSIRYCFLSRSDVAVLLLSLALIARTYLFHRAHAR